MNKKVLVKYLNLLHSEGHITKDTWNSWDLYDIENIPSILKSVPFWDEWFVIALLKINKKNIIDGTLSEDNVIIPEKKLYRLHYVVKENLYQGTYYEDTVEGYDKEQVEHYFHSSEFEYWEGTSFDTETYDSDVTGVELEGVFPQKNNNINESSEEMEEKPYGECNFSADEFINCVQNHSDLETLYMMRTIIDDEIERFERMISIAKNSDREPIGFKFGKK